MLVEVLQKIVNLGEVAEEVFVGSEAALFNDSVVALAGLHEAQLVLLGDAAGGSGKLAHALDLAVVALVEGSAVASVNVSHGLFSFSSGVFPSCRDSY